MTDFKLSHHGHQLRVSTPERSCLSARPVWAAPLSRPGKFLALIDEAGDEVAMVEDPETLPAETREVLDEELRRRYLTAQVSKINLLDPQNGTTYFTVETDRGEKTFVMQHLHDNVIHYSATRVLLLDVDGNRYEIPDLSRLDDRSKALLRIVL